MSDRSTIDAMSGPRQITPAEMTPEKPGLALSGYCAECGTWDTHGPSCRTCGYDFGGADVPAPND